MELERAFVFVVNNIMFFCFFFFVLFFPCRAQYLTLNIGTLFPRAFTLLLHCFCLFCLALRLFILYIFTE